MPCVEKHTLLLKYKYVNAVVAELAGLKAALFSIESLYNGVLRLRLVRYSDSQT